MSSKKTLPITIYRTHLSNYLEKDFIDIEKSRLLAVAPKAQYTLDFKTAKKMANPLVVITNAHTTLKDLEKLPLEHLKLIIHPNSGYDHFTADWVKRSPAPIILGQPIRANAVTEYILSVLFKHLDALSPLPVLKELSWDSKRQWRRPLLCEQNIQIIGTGHVGKLLKKTLTPLARKVWAYDPFLDCHELHLEKADIIILACGLNNSSRYFLQKKQFAQLKKTVHIINAARGKLICERDLANFLNNNPKAYATLDVFENEPEIGQELKNCTNITRTAHVAGVFENLPEKIISFTEIVLKDFLSLTPLQFKNKYKKTLLLNYIKSGELI